MGEQVPRDLIGPRLRGAPIRDGRRRAPVYHPVTPSPRHPVTKGPTVMPAEQMISDPPTEPLTVDTSPTLDVKTFDLEAFINGARPVRRGIRIHDQAHLVGRLEYLADLIDAAPEDADVDDLIDEAEQAQTAFRQGIWWEVEARSEEWVRRFRAQEAAKHGASTNAEARVVGKDGQPDTDAEARVIIAQAAAQTVTPAGVTTESLTALMERSGPEFNKILVAMTMANSQVPELAKVVGRDFSQRRSTKGKTRGSSKR